MHRILPQLQRQVRQSHTTAAPTTDEEVQHTEAAPKTDSSPSHLLHLQGIIGNQAVQRLILQRAPADPQSGAAPADLQRVTEGEDYVHSAHSRQRMTERNISQTQLERTLDNPDFVNNLGGGRLEYLSQLPSGLIMRVIVSDQTPMTIITMMKVRKHKSYR